MNVVWKGCLVNWWSQDSQPWSHWSWTVQAVSLSSYFYMVQLTGTSCLKCSWANPGLDVPCFHLLAWKWKYFCSKHSGLDVFVFVVVFWPKSFHSSAEILKQGKALILCTSFFTNCSILGIWKFKLWNYVVQNYSMN